MCELNANVDGSGGQVCGNGGGLNWHAVCVKYIGRNAMSACRKRHVELRSSNILVRSFVPSLFFHANCETQSHHLSPHNRVPRFSFCPSETTTDFTRSHQANVKSTSNAAVEVTGWHSWGRGLSGPNYRYYRQLLNSTCMSCMSFKCNSCMYAPYHTHPSTPDLPSHEKNAYANLGRSAAT